MHSQDPVIEAAEVCDLRPTQMTVGLREVAETRRSWDGRADKTR